MTKDKLQIPTDKSNKKSAITGAIRVKFSKS